MTAKRDADMDDEVMAEALRWCAVLHDEATTEADHRDFALWRARNPTHDAAWRRALAVWACAGEAEPIFRAAGRPSFLRRPAVRALAASVALLACGGILAGRPDLFADQRTAAGEHRTLTLSDGSTVEMGSATALSAVMGGQVRRVVLHGGEAFFTVAADAVRPFEVEARGGNTRALGTAFDVKAVDGAVTVTVTEHAVAVSLPGREAVTVGEGRQVRYGAEGLEEVSPADLRQAQAWRRSRLIFQEAPLSRVVAELSRYRYGMMVVTDRRLAGLPVTAVFDAARVDEALQTMAETLPLRVTDLGMLTLIRPAD